MPINGAKPRRSLPLILVLHKPTYAQLPEELHLHTRAAWGATERGATGRWDSDRLCIQEASCRIHQSGSPSPLSPCAKALLLPEELGFDLSLSPLSLGKEHHPQCSRCVSQTSPDPSAIQPCPAQSSMNAAQPWLKLPSRQKETSNMCFFLVHRKDSTGRKVSEAATMMTTPWLL